MAETVLLTSGASPAPPAPPRSFTWDEIKPRSGRAPERWLVIDRKVYDITQFHKRHPGGSRVISHYAGQDATDPFTAFHIDKTLVRKYMKPLLVGELAADQPSFEPWKKKQLTEDFRELRGTVEKMGLLEPNHIFFFLYLAHILALDVAAWLNLWYFGCSLVPFLLSGVLLGTVQAQAGWLQHDFGHLSVFGSSRWNHWVHKFVIGHLKVSNLEPQQINLEPLGRRLGSLRGWQCDPHIFVFCRIIESHWFVWVTQMNHIPMNIDYDQNVDWVSTQLQATCNVDQSLFNDWFSGHLNFQIEHHLFPTMPRHNYWKVAPLVKSLCAKHGIEYQSKPLLTAFADIV
ncbi:hypothetical protein JRQ81_000206 [Phrynocephalus forsythii]|uniref:Cytochrome b5 heme-binding domain-containing protein n=1 Tax=Phrynocephalus forsythii TaxID=171643 RepID=A0A9Q0Y643_9SAUR|nr:hypothetical protein JRQ81_000206 [Phrynocephalus forsythii]